MLEIKELRQLKDKTNSIAWPSITMGWIAPFSNMHELCFDPTDPQA